MLNLKYQIFQQFVDTTMSPYNNDLVTFISTSKLFQVNRNSSTKDPIKPKETEDKPKIEEMGFYNNDLLKFISASWIMARTSSKKNKCSG